MKATYLLILLLLAASATRAQTDSLVFHLRDGTSKAFAIADINQIRVDSLDKREVLRARPPSRVGAYPNPTSYESKVPVRSERGGKVSVEVWDEIGRLVRSIPTILPPETVSTVTWDCKNDGGEPVPSGTYDIILKLPEGNINILSIVGVKR